jgi:zinc finger protein CreA/MIG
MITDQGHHIYASNGRFDSPPPTLAPIQEQRRDECHSSSPYIHQQAPDYSHHQYTHLSMGHWKSESGLRKGVGALIQ